MSVRRTVLAVLIGVVAVLGGTQSQAAAATSGDGSGVGIRLLEAPVERKDDPRARLYVVDHVRPGTVVTRRFEVENDTGGRAELQLYAAAADAAGDGWSVRDGRAGNALTDWMTVTPDRVTLEPGETAEAVAEIRVPADAPSGENYAAVLAELPGDPRSGAQVVVNTRVGIRVYLSVGPGGEPASDFEVSTLTPQRLEDGTPAVTAQVTNTGGRALDLSGELELTGGPGGLRAGPFPVDVRTLGIGSTGDVSVTLDDALPAGPWQARLVMRSGRLEKAVEATLTFPEAGQVGPRVTAEPLPLAEDPSVVIPVAIGILALLIALLAAQFLRRYGRHRSAPPPAEDVFVPEARRAADDAVRS